MERNSGARPEATETSDVGSAPIATGKEAAQARRWTPFVRVQSQLELEELMKTAGQLLSAARLQDLSVGEEAAATGGVRRLLVEGVSRLESALESRVFAARRGRPAKARRILRDAVRVISDPAELASIPGQLALLALKLILDRIRHQPRINTLTEIVGRGAYVELCAAALKHQRADVWDHISSHGVTRLSLDYQERCMDETREFFLGEVQLPPRWGMKEVGEVGHLLVRLALKTTGLFEIEHEYQVNARGRPKKIALARLTDEAKARVEAIEDDLIEAAFEAPPMIVPPRDWSDLWSGGYLTIRVPLVGRRIARERLESDVNAERADLSRVYSALNQIQSTGWSINRRVLQVARHHLKRLGIEGDRCLPNFDRVTFPPGDPRPSRLAATRAGLSAAQAFSPRESFYVPHRLDWRGRVYPVCTRLHLQRPGLERALLLFASRKPLNTVSGYEWFLRFGAHALGGGLERRPIAHQVSGMESRSLIDEVKAINENPFIRNQWQYADSPWEYLAWCFEYARYLKELRGSGPNLGFETALPVTMDATASGIQHLALAMRSREDARRVNLLGSPEPQDLYQDVADVLRQGLVQHTESRILSAWRDSDLITRSLVKGPCMTALFGGGAVGRRQAIREFLVDREDRAPFPPGDFTQAAWALEQHVRRAIDAVVGDVSGAMDYLKKLARAVAHTNQDLCWTAPSGFPVHQVCREPLRHEIRTRLFGGAAWTWGGPKTTLLEEGPDVAPDAHERGIVPNWVHSMDAAHLVLSVNAVDFPLGVIHDCFRVHPSNAAQMYSTLVEELAQMYSENRLESLRGELGRRYGLADLPQSPTQGDLEIEEILDSVWAFS